MKKTSKLEPKKEYIAQNLVAGKSQNELAKELNVNQSTVSRFSSKEEVKGIIEKEAMRLLGCVPDAIDNIMSAVQNYKNIDVSDTKNRELSLKASMRVLETAGMLNSTSPSQVVINLQKEAEEKVISPEILKLLQTALAGEPIEFIDGMGEVTETDEE